MKRIWLMRLLMIDVAIIAVVAMCAAMLLRSGISAGSAYFNIPTAAIDGAPAHPLAASLKR
jgi:hypothetical protein